MPRKREPEFYIATSTGVLKVDGKSETFIAGRTIVARDSALYRKYPHLFKPVEHPTVEKATAAPGERR